MPSGRREKCRVPCQKKCTEPFDTHDPTEWQLNNEASSPETVPYSDVQSDQPALHQAEEEQKDRFPTRACNVEAVKEVPNVHTNIQILELKQKSEITQTGQHRFSPQETELPIDQWVDIRTSEGYYQQITFGSPPKHEEMLLRHEERQQPFSSLLTHLFATQEMQHQKELQKAQQKVVDLQRELMNKKQCLKQKCFIDTLHNNLT